MKLPQKVRKLKIAIAIIIATALNASAQSKLAFINEINKAQNLYRERQFNASAVTYARAIKSNSKHVRDEDLYNAACSWALAGNADSSFFYLNKLVKSFHYPYIGSLKQDKDFTSLRTDSRWKNIIDVATLNRQKADAKLNRPLMKQLDSIFNADQVRRRKIDSIQKTYGMQSAEYRELWDTINYNDSINLIKVEKIIKQYGWPGIDMVGEIGNRAVWLVIQHADLKKQIKYLPLLRKSVEKGASKPNHLALMEDKMLVHQAKPQIYGSQYEFDDKTQKYKLYPIADERHVNDRRKLVGLPPLEQEAKAFGVDYKLPE